MATTSQEDMPHFSHKAQRDSKAGKINSGVLAMFYSDWSRFFWKIGMLMLLSVDVGHICNGELYFRKQCLEEAVGGFERGNLLVLFLV